MNENELLPGLTGGQFAFDINGNAPMFATDPVVHISRKFGRPLADLEKFGDFWLVNRRAKEALDAVETASFGFIRCKARTDAPGETPEYWFCHVIPIVDAIDPDRSSVKAVIADTGRLIHHLLLPFQLTFKAEAVEGLHIFRPATARLSTFCDDEFARRFKAFDLKGWRFQPV